MIESEQKYDFFNTLIDITLIATATISTTISLTIPCLYYIKKQCRQHPTVLIANIVLFEAIANFNVLLMAYNLYGYEDFFGIKNIFHILTFNLIQLPSNDQNNDLCNYNFIIYMLFELLSISFHICYSIDLFLTIKFPFLSGKKRRKYYYLFSFFFTLITLISSMSQAPQICSQDIKYQSIFIVPFQFLLTLIVFFFLSIATIIISFQRQKMKSNIRKLYINHHRMILSLLLLFWICPIWSNILIHIGMQQSAQFDIINIISFFSICTSSGIISIVRISYDKVLRTKIKQMLSLKKSAINKEQINETSNQQIQLTTKTKRIQDDVWNLTLSGAMNEFQSQEIVHIIIQVITECCTQFKITNSTNGIIRQSNSRCSLYDSVLRNTIVIENQIQSIDQSLLNIFHKKNQGKYDKIDPLQCDISQLKQISKRKRKFKMVCIFGQKIQNTNQRLKTKTVHNIKNYEAQEQFPQMSVILDVTATSYAHRIFQSLRIFDGVDFEEIFKSFDLQKNIENVKQSQQSLGASGSFFFFSYDSKFIIKTITEEEKDKMIQILPHYYDHIRYNSNSLLARTYGVFSLQIKSISKIYFILIQNTCKQLQNEQIPYKIYDMKGSTIQRQVKKKDAKVLKDINYFKSPECFIFMSKKNKLNFMDQVQKDLNMLKKQNIMDFSLLLIVGKSKQKKNRRKMIANGLKQNEIDNFRYIRQLQQLTKRVYSISIIDYLQEFNFGKKMELWLKKLFKGGGDISSVNTQMYHKRFKSFLNKIVLIFNIKFQSNSSIKLD